MKVQGFIYLTITVGNMSMLSHIQPDAIIPGSQAKPLQGLQYVMEGYIHYVMFHEHSKTTQIDVVSNRTNLFGGIYLSDTDDQTLG